MTHVPLLIGSVVLMIGLIPLIPNDYVLTLLYICIITCSLYIQRKKRDAHIFALGFFGMILSEYFFISTGVETFVRNSLFGMMPLWLPFLWGYSFIVMRRIIHVIEAT